ncbi:hypothetical protein [Chryseobacterium sp. OV279]|uniref:hypothetical protein n=1 Tax=Chryseobacterium sp. OV279 TaxID=1500285 RepID=UPI0009184AC1|nr:hypothetical protein [Chryseobacterium sp. OV279]SHG70403.1 hypothetical protein SAMN02787100_4564 [Chryseobacterium sp. OV279]
MRKIKLIILVLVLCIGTNTIAQNRPEESLSLISNATTNNDLYNGTVNVSIPLFKIPIGNLTLSNEISNVPTGFRPRVDESIFGLHWNANLFGSITRETNTDFLLTKYAAVQPGTGVSGIYPSDESKARETTDCIIQRQNFDYGFVASKKQILQNPNNSGIQSDFIPDKFYFDFFGYKGYFVFDNYGNPLVFCENAKLQVVGPGSLASKCYSVTSPIDFQNKNISEIRIMDDKGNTFYFGGSYDALEINYSDFFFAGNYYNLAFQSNVSFASGSRANYILSWFLKKVELSNGEVIEATYKQRNADAFNSFLQNTLYNNDAGFPTSYPTSAQLEAANIEVSKSYEISTSTTEQYVAIKNFTKRAIIDNIKIIGKNISVNYIYFKDNNNLIHLNSINLNYFGKSQSINFNQTPLGGQNYRYFLTSLVNNSEVYSFQYEKTETLPSKNSYGTNDFGYWNGTNSRGIGNSNTFFDATLLKKIVYPNKGYTIFNGEKADVSKKVFDGMIDYTLMPSDGMINRIANRIDFDGVNEYKTNYTYQLSDGKSSGIILTQFRSGRISNEEIKYSQVQENIENKGRTEYFFSDLISNPDNSFINTKQFNSTALSQISFNGQENGAYQRGKLLKKKIFNSSNKLLRESLFEYESFLRPENELVDLAGNACSTCKISDENYYVLTKIDKSNSQHKATLYAPVIPYLLKKEKVIDYLNGQQITAETNTKYRESNISWHPYPEQIETTTALGTSIKKYIYPYELNPGRCRWGCPVNETIVGGQNPMYQAMINSNVWFPVIEIAKNENNKYSLQENLFYHSSFVPKKIRQSKLDAVLDFTNYKISVDQTVDGLSYDLLDDKANYLQTTNKSGISTVSIYGYKQTSPIVNIVGITYVQLMQILGQPTSPTDYLNLDIVTKSNADVNPATEQELLNSLDIFRNNPLLKDYPMTTYTYDPLIGVTSITQPSGIREVYIYDTANRLMEIRENSTSGKILKEFKYNYKQ